MDRAAAWLKGRTVDFVTACGATPVRVCLLSAVIINLIIELLARRSLFKLGRFLFERPVYCFYGALVIFFTLTFGLLVKRRAFAIAFIGGVWLCMGIANFVLLCFRSTPFGGYDFLNIRAGLDLIDIYMKPWQIVLAAVGIVAFTALTVMAYRRMPRVAVTQKMAATFAVAAAVTAMATAAGSNWQLLPGKMPNLPDAFDQNGFVYCFARTLLDRGIDRPKDYGVKTMRDIADELGGGGSESGIRPDIIMVQLESFFDVGRMKNLTFSSDPLPNFRALAESNPSGLLVVPVVGAGTVNTEFEVLTGMSLEYFGAGEQPYRTMLPDTVCPSLCFDLDKYGYTATAIHNNDGTFYERHRVYPNLGFDYFVSQEYMENISYNDLGWIRDACLTEEINKALEATEGSDFIYTVSVQPHGKYPTEGDFDTPIRVGGLSEDGERETQFNYYINQLAETDAFVGDLKRSLDERGKPYVLALFGDHLPSLDIEDEELSSGGIFMTEYVIVTNTDLTFDGGNIYAYQLASRVMEGVGLHGGEIDRLHRERAEDIDEYYRRLELLEYDLLYGDKIVLGGENPYTATDMRMGMERITVSGYYTKKGGLFVTGEGFNDFSEVYINGDRADMTYAVDENILFCPDTEPEEGDEITVAQAGDDRIPLSFSNVIIFSKS